MSKPREYKHIDPRDYDGASPHDMREQAKNEPERGGTPERAEELERLATSKENRLFRDPSRLAILYGFDSKDAYLRHCQDMSAAFRWAESHKVA